ncbi:MAG: DUF1905 domain-containing protein [Armatimonadetes bacterium]|nr:DUF1905 domain-containing protein [Armatimonadota bacterium]
MTIEVTGSIWYWRGPAPFHFVTVPAEESQGIKEVSSKVTYGWGVIPVRVRCRATEWTTSLFPKDGLYLVPIKDKVRRAESLQEGDEVSLTVVVETRS